MVTNVNKLKIKTLLLSIGAGALIGNSISIYITFLQAYFNNYKLTICVNLYGEAIFEFIFLPIILIIGIWTIYYLLKKYLKKEFKKG